MTFLLQLYPGDPFMLLVATVIGQVAVIAVLGLVLTRFPKRRSAATRSAIWLAALVCVLLTPLLACGFGIAKVEFVRLPFLARAEPETEPRLPMRVSQRRASPDAAAPVSQPVQHAEKPADQQSRVSVSEVSPQAIESASPSSELTSSAGVDPWRAAAVCGLLLWFAGVSVFAVRFLYGCLILKRLRAGARPVDERAVVAMHQDVCRVLGIRRYPRIMRSPHVGGPIVTNGLRGPMVILPHKLLRGLKDRQLRDVLMHECAHLLQRDILLGILQRIAQLIYWPHPLVHLLNRALTRAREDICDNYVLRQGDAPAYARTLVHLSTALRYQRTPIAAYGMFDPVSELETRIEALLDDGRDLMTLTKRSLLLTFGLLFLGISVLSLGSRLVEAGGVEDADVRAAAQEDKEEEEAADDGKASPAITGRVLFKAESGARILAVAISPDDELVATVDEQVKVVVRTADSGRMLLSFSVLTPEEKKLLLPENRQGRIHTAAIDFEPDPRKLTRTLAVACDSVIRFYDSETGRLQRSLEDKRLVDELKELGKDDPTEVEKLTTIPHAHGLTYSIAFSPDGSRLASSGTHLLRPGGRSVINAEIPTHGKLKLWEAKTGELKHDLGKHYDRVRSLAFSRDGLAAIASHPPSWTSSVRFWDPVTGAVNKTLVIRGGGIGGDALTVSPDGALVAVVAVYSSPSPGGVDILTRFCHVHVWDARTGELVIKRKMPKLVTSIAFSPDSKTLATCSYGGVTFRDPKTLREKGKLQPSTGPPRPVQLAYSANGTRMAIAANDNDMKQGLLTLWKLDVPTTQPGSRVASDEKKPHKPATEGQKPAIERRARGEYDWEKKRRSERQQRLDTFAQVCVEWHQAALDLDAGTTSRLKELMDGLIRDSQREWSVGHDDFGYFIFVNWTPGAAYVLLHGRESRPGPSAWEKGRRELLNEMLRKSLAGALSERRAFLEEQAIRGLVGVFDQRVVLNSEQRTQAAAGLQRIFGHKVLAKPFVLPSENSLLWVLDDPEFRRDIGADAVKVLRSGPVMKTLRPRVVVKCMSEDSKEQREQILKDATAGAETQLSEQMAKRIKFLVDQYELSDDQEQTLETAAKGVGIRVQKRWHASLGAQIEPMADRVRKRHRGKNSPMTLSTPVSASPHEEPVWVSAVNRVLVGKVPNRAEARTAMVSQMMVVLDLELWLRKDQRAGLWKLVNAAVQNLGTNHYRRQANEALSNVLEGVSGDELAKVLSPGQIEVWALLRKGPISPVPLDSGLVPWMKR